MACPCACQQRRPKPAFDPQLRGCKPQVLSIQQGYTRQHKQLTSWMSLLTNGAILYDDQEVKPLTFCLPDLPLPLIRLEHSNSLLVLGKYGCLMSTSQINLKFKSVAMGKALTTGLTVVSNQFRELKPGIILEFHVHN